jgi:O-antigen/teichoic acid export membrane protein
VDLFYGEKWSPMTGAMQLLCVYALFRSLSAIVHELFKAVGQPRLIHRFALGKFLAVGLLGIPAVMYFRLEGIASLLALSFALVFVWEVRVACRFIAVPFADFAAALWRPVVGSAASVLVVYAAVAVLLGARSLSAAIWGIALTGPVYLMFVALMDRNVIRDIRQLKGSRQAA